MRSRTMNMSQGKPLKLLTLFTVQLPLAICYRRHTS